MSIQIQKVTDKSFRKYGRILTGEYDVAELMDAMEKTECPDDAVIYIPSDKEIEKLPVMKAFTDSLYGGLPIQIGYCNGNNHLLNAVEYHRSSSSNVAASIWGKLKTVTQMIAIILAFIDTNPFGAIFTNSLTGYNFAINLIVTLMMIICVIATIFSGWDYIKNGKDLLK